MTVESIPVRDANRQSVDVLTEIVAEKDGVPATSVVEGQVVKFAHGPDGEFNVAAPESPIPSADFTPPLIQLEKNGIDLVAGEVTPIVGLNVNRRKIDVLCDQDDAERLVKLARVWIEAGIDDPIVGKGGFLRPDGAWSEWTQEPVTVLADTDCHVSWVEWG